MELETRKIIKIDEAACNGCGICVEACHEGAIALVEGKAKLTHDYYCDGLGDCLPACPTGAITFEVREAAPYDELAVVAHLESQAQANAALEADGPSASENSEAAQASSAAETSSMPSQLRQWPIQIKLVSPQAPYFAGADLLVAADCTAFAYGSFHQDFMKDKVTIIGCPKLDAVDYTEKLTQIVSDNDIASITVARMQVPCCAGIERAVQQAVANSGKYIPISVVTISSEGQVL